jgi:hypothetical protein
MIDFFNKEIDLKNLTCHSGGAIGSDSFFEEMNEIYGVKTKAYSYKTKSHTTKNKVEISDDVYKHTIIC